MTKKNGINAKKLAEQYKKRARDERAAGGKVEITSHSILIQLSDDTVYRADWQVEELMTEAMKDMKDSGIDDLLTIEDFLLAQAQNW